MASDGSGYGPSSFGIPHPPQPDDADLPGSRDASGNKYRRRVEDIDPARAHPSAMIEHHEQLRPRPSPFTVEGYIQGFRDLSDAAITGHGQRRSRARLLVVMTLAALLVPIGLQLLGFLHII